MTVFSPPQSWIGRRGEFDAPVTDADTAIAVGSSDSAMVEDGAGGGEVVGGHTR